MLCGAATQLVFGDSRFDSFWRKPPARFASKSVLGSVVLCPSVYCAPFLADSQSSSPTSTKIITNRKKKYEDYNSGRKKISLNLNKLQKPDFEKAGWLEKKACRKVNKTSVKAKKNRRIITKRNLFCHSPAKALKCNYTNNKRREKAIVEINWGLKTY